MRNAISVAALLLLAGTASANIVQVRTPVTTISGPGSTNVVIAAQNEVLAVAYGSVAGQVRLYTIGTWAPLATLSLSDSGALVQSIAIQNDYIAVGAWDSGSTEGSVYIFAKPQSGWANESSSAVLTASDASTGGLFGQSVAVWGNTLVVGSPGVSSNTGNGYVFIEPQSGWVNATETAQLTASDGQAWWQVGWSVAVRGSVGSGGNLIALGAPQNNGVNTLGCGQVYVYYEPQNGWVSSTETAMLYPPCRSGYAQGGGGYSISLAAASNGDTWLVGGAPFDPEGYENVPDGFIWSWFSKPGKTFVTGQGMGTEFHIGSKGYLLGEVSALTQNGTVLLGCCGNSTGKPGTETDNAFLWHYFPKVNEWNLNVIELSAHGLTTTLDTGAFVRGWAFLGDTNGNVYVFNGK